MEKLLQIINFIMKNHVRSQLPDHQKSNTKPINNKNKKKMTHTLPTRKRRLISQNIRKNIVIDHLIITKTRNYKLIDSIQKIKKNKLTFIRKRRNRVKNLITMKITSKKTTIRSSTLLLPTILPTYIPHPLLTCIPIKSLLTACLQNPIIIEECQWRLQCTYLHLTLSTLLRGIQKIMR